MRHLAMIPTIALLLACGQQADEPAGNAGPEVAVNDTTAEPAGNGNASAPAEDADDAADVGAEPGMRWAFVRTAAGPKLTYGEPNTDNVKLMLRCAGRDSVRISFMRRAGAAGGEMIVRSGGAQQRLDATAEESVLGGVTIQATAPIRSQPLQNYRGGSPLQVRWQGETISVPAAGDEARQLFDACRA